MSDAPGATAPDEPTELDLNFLPVDNPDEHAPIRIRGLRLSGPRRDYIVDFTDDDGNLMPLALVAGEISTGKTTVLDFIDYCLGATNHPVHPEVIDNVRTAQLAVEILERASTTDDTEAGPDAVLADTAHLARYVIERPVGSALKTVMLFRGDHHGLADTPPRRLTTDPKDADSLSQFLLRACGLAGLRTRQAPSQDESRTAILSFRDLMPLAFLANRRLDNADLVYEKNSARTLKLRQVVDYFFGVSDQEESDVAEQIEALRVELRDAESGLKALRSFLIDAGVPTEDDIVIAASEARVRRARLADQLAEINSTLTASTRFATTARDDYHGAAQTARELAGRVRERETLLARLAPLQSQYADDLHKIDLLDESQRLFDALSVTVCPACQSTLADPVAIEDGRCTLCHTEVPHLRHRLLSGPSADEGRQPGAGEDSAEQGASVPAGDDTAESGEAPTLDVPADGPTELARERRNVKRRLSELMTFIDDVGAEVSALIPQLDSAQTAVAAAQRRLDAATSQVIAPFIAQRDQLTGQLAAADADLATLTGHRKMHAQLIERERGHARISAALGLAKERRRLLEESRQSRDEVISRLSRRFEATLTDFGFPKLADAYLTRALIPMIRGHRYDQIGSAGAMTLLALAWELTIFEETIERGQGHPGFLLIDSPQKNLRPGTVAAQTPPAGDEDDVSDADIAINAASIVDRVYAHITTWLAENSGRAQILMVDNEPPASVPESAIAVRYGGSTGAPPYGLIDDAID